MKNKKYQGKIEPIREPKHFVYVEGSHAPVKEHDTYNSAFQEALRLSKTTGKTVHIIKLVTTIELIQNVKQYE